MSESNTGKQVHLSVVDELRSHLMDEIRKLRDGKTTAASANAVTNAAGKYFSSIKLELEVCKSAGVKPRADLMGQVGQHSESPTGDHAENLGLPVATREDVKGSVDRSK